MCRPFTWTLLGAGLLFACVNQREEEAPLARRVPPAPSAVVRAPASASPPRGRLPDGPRVLANRQYFPDQGEAETVGSLDRPILAKSRDAERLLVCPGDQIVFKDEERTGADRRMTRATCDAVLRLGALVEAEWKGVQLRVTEAWDCEREHGGRSLHYEGRAVNLTTSDVERSKLGRLAGLAIQAGFHWVYFESSHVHASMKRE